MNQRQPFRLPTCLWFICALTTTCLAREDAFNLGLLGAEGNPVTEEEAEELGLKNDNAVRITAILDDGPAEKAPLEKGDIIVGVGKGSLPKKKDPIYALMEYIEAVTSSKEGRLPLIVRRDGKNVTVNVALPYLGKHASTCPIKCPRCDRLIEQSLEYLAEKQESDGSFPCPLGGTNGKVVVTSICGLAFMAGGSTNREGQYAKVIDKAVKYVANNCGKEFSFGVEGGGNWSQVNWAYGYALLFLAEIYQKKHCDDFRKTLFELSRETIKNQEASGGWAHGPGGPNALGYLELEVVGNWCLASLGMLRQLKIDVPDETIEKGTRYIQDCSGGDGGVGYSTREGQKGVGDVGRTAGAIFAFAKLGLLKHPFAKKMSGYFWRHMENVPNGHVSPVMHFTASALASCHLEPKYWNKFMETFRLEILAARRPDGSFAARPTFESLLLKSNTDRTMGDCWTTGSYVLILEMRKGHLPLLAGTGEK